MATSIGLFVRFSCFDFCVFHGRSQVFSGNERPLQRELTQVEVTVYAKTRLRTILKFFFCILVSLY